MYIIKVTSRFRNNFHFEALCRYCGKTSHHGDGYADAIYQQGVFPDRQCEHCGMNEHGETEDEREARYSKSRAA